MGCGRPGHRHGWPEVCPRHGRRARHAARSTRFLPSAGVEARFTMPSASRPRQFVAADPQAYVHGPPGHALLSHSAPRTRLRIRPVAAAHRLRPKRRLSNCAGRPKPRGSLNRRSRPIAFWFFGTSSGTGTAVQSEPSATGRPSRAPYTSPFMVSAMSRTTSSVSAPGILGSPPPNRRMVDLRGDAAYRKTRPTEGSSSRSARSQLTCVS
jgi:hypothetical protein